MEFRLLFRCKSCLRLKREFVMLHSKIRLGGLVAKQVSRFPRMYQIKKEIELCC